MSSRVNVSYDEKQTNSEIFQLTDVVTNESIALIPCDSAGNFSISGVTRAPIQKNAIQTTSQGGDWSDLEYPWMAIQQEDWTGGRANLTFSKDKSRFFDSRRAQTAFNSCIFNAPLEYYSEFSDVKKAYTNYPNNVTWVKINANTSHLIKAIDVDEYNCGAVYIHLKRHGKPVSGLTVRLVDTKDDDPTVIQSHQYTVDEITDITAEFKKFTFPSTSLDGTVYLEVFSSNADESNYWEVGCTPNPDSNTWRSTDRTNWELFQNELLYRLDCPDYPLDCKFFMYEQIEFAVLHKNYGNPSLLINGTIEVATSATTTSITTASSYDDNIYAGAKIGLVYRFGSESYISAWRTITSHSNGTFNIDKAWDIKPGTGSVFIITDTPYWRVYDNPPFTSRITDIHVIRDTVYFCQGDYAPILKMRYNFNTPGWEWETLTGIYASFLRSVRDSNGMTLYRGRNDGINNRRTVERAWLLDWLSETTTWDKITTALTTKMPSTESVTETENIVNTTDSTDINDITASNTINKSTTVTVGTESYTDTASESTTIREQKSGSVTTKTTNSTINKTSNLDTTVLLRTSITTESKDFSFADYDKKQYVVTIENFESDNNTGTLTVTLQESEDNTAFHNVETITATGTGIWRIFAHCQYPYRRFLITAGGTNCTVNNISISTSDTLHFEDPVFLLDNYGKITKLFEFGPEEEKSLWIFQEGMVGSINKVDGTIDTYTYDRINLDELQTTADEWNGSVVNTSNIYLMWAWLNGLQRFYNVQVEGRGPDHDEGLPRDMQGRITQIVSYPGSFFISIDAGSEGYSSVMMFNGNGYHNIYRAPNKGERILDMGFQPIYGERPDRLWIQVGTNIIWLAMPSKILYALQDPAAEYTHESVVVSSWLTGGMAEVDKLWQSLSIMADNLDGETCWIEADYQVDEETEWHPIPTNPFDTSPQQEEPFAGENESVNGKKLRYRLRLQTTDIHKSAKVNAVLIKAVGRIDIKYSYGLHFRNIKWKENLSSDYQEIEPYELQCILDDWANKLCTLRMNSAYKIFDNKRVFVDATTTSVLTEKREGYISQITLTEI